MHLADWIDRTVGGIVLGLMTGSFAYTYKSTKDKATKEDISDLRDRVNLIYEHLLNKNLDEELNKRNGKLE